MHRKQRTISDDVPGGGTCDRRSRCPGQSQRRLRRLVSNPIVEQAALEAFSGPRRAIMTERPAPNAANEVSDPGSALRSHHFLRILPDARQPQRPYQYHTRRRHRDAISGIGHRSRSGRGGSSALHRRRRHPIPRCHRQGTVDRQAGSKSRGQGELIWRTEFGDGVVAEPAEKYFGTRARPVRATFKTYIS